MTSSQTPFASGRTSVAPDGRMTRTGFADLKTSVRSGTPASRQSLAETTKSAFADDPSRADISPTTSSPPSFAYRSEIPPAVSCSTEAIPIDLRSTDGGKPTKCVAVFLKRM